MIDFGCILIKAPMKTDACIAIAFWSKWLQSKHCINAIDGINNHKMLGMLIPLFRCSFILYSVFYCFPYIRSYSMTSKVLLSTMYIAIHHYKEYRVSYIIPINIPYSTTSNTTLPYSTHVITTLVFVTVLVSDLKE